MEEWDDSLFLQHQHWDDPNYFPETYPEMAFTTPSATKRKLFGAGGNEVQGDKAEDAIQIYPNQLQQEAMQVPHHDAPPARNVNSKTRCLNEKNLNILPSGTESEVNNLKGKAIFTSVTPMTPIEKKRMSDQKYRKRKREEQINLLQENKNLHEDLQRLNRENADLKNVIKQLTSGNNGQPKSSLILERKAKFELNFHDDESKKGAMTAVLNLPAMDDIHLKVKKRILKLKGCFDTEAVLHMLNKVCDTHLVNKVNVPSMSGHSTVPKLRIPSLKLR